ncbi:hypothetical protein [Agromyces sp. NPDC058104]|uniref:hypothetical protein n=1 Tax=Agromyces sp. NPDC058104 TaxID=3346342 RepID=UPI0036DBA261
MAPKLSITAVAGVAVGVAAVGSIGLGVGWSLATFALGVLAVTLGLISRAHLRRDSMLSGVRLSMLAVLIGAVALFFSVPVLVLTLTNLA